MFIEESGEELKLMRCIGQSALRCVVDRGMLHPAPHSRVGWCYEFLPGIEVRDMEDGCYEVNEMRDLRKMLSHADRYEDVYVDNDTSEGSSGCHFKVTDRHGDVWLGPRVKKCTFASEDDKFKYEPCITHDMYLDARLIDGDDLKALKGLASLCGDSRYKTRDVWIEEDGTAVATDSRIMAWRKIKSPGQTLCIPGMLIAEAKKSLIVWQKGSLRWSYAQVDGFRMYMFENDTAEDGEWINWRRPVPESPRFTAIDRGVLSLDKENLKKTSIRFSPPEMRFAEFGFELLLDPRYVEAVRKLMGRGKVGMYTDIDKFVDYGDGDGRHLRGPVWFRTEGTDVLVMPRIY